MAKFFLAKAESYIPNLKDWAFRAKANFCKMGENQDKLTIYMPFLELSEQNEKSLQLFEGIPHKNAQFSYDFYFNITNWLYLRAV